MAEEDNNRDNNQNTITPTITTLSQEEKLEFFKCFLADKPYEEEVELFGGKFKLTFRCLTVEESADVFAQLKKDQFSEKITTDAAYMLQLTNYRLGLSIKEINGEPFFPEITKESYKPDGDNDSYVVARSKPFSKWPIFKLGAVAEAFKDFENKVVALTAAIQDENFWSADQ